MFLDFFQSSVPLLFEREISLDLRSVSLTPYFFSVQDPILSHGAQFCINWNELASHQVKGSCLEWLLYLEEVKQSYFENRFFWVAHLRWKGER